MRKTKWVIRCIAEREAPDLWVAVCLDFDLAAQGDSLDDARRRLDIMLNEYVEDALTGEDRDHAETLLNRRAPWRYWLRFYWFSVVDRLRRRPPRSHLPFHETLPLTLAR